MKTRYRWDRAAGAALAATGGFLLVFAVVGLAPAVADLGAGDEHVAGDATMTLMIAGPMLAVVVLFTLYCAWQLWRGSHGATALALVWIAAAGSYAGSALAGFGNVLWAVRTVVLEPDRLLVRWPYLYWDPFLGSNVIGTPMESLPYGRLDDVTFWLPGVIALAAITVAVLLLAGWIGGRPAGRA